MKEEQKMSLENSSFKLDSVVSIKGGDLMALSNNVDILLDEMTSYVMPLKFKFIDKDGEPVEEGTEGATMVFDPFETYNQKNIVKGLVFKSYLEEDLKFEYNSLLSAIETKRRYLELLNKEIESGNAILTEDLMKQFKKDGEK